MVQVTQKSRKVVEARRLVPTTPARQDWIVTLAGVPNICQDTVHQHLQYGLLVFQLQISEENHLKSVPRSTWVLLGWIGTNIDAF